MNSGPGLRTPDALSSTTVARKSRVIISLVCRFPVCSILWVYVAPRSWSCPAIFVARVTHGLDHRSHWVESMPTNTIRTKKAFQEIARVFNKLASELTADFSHAVREIETLRKEVQRLKTSSGRTGRPSSGPRRGSSSRPRRSTTPSSPTPSHTGPSHASPSQPTAGHSEHPQTHHEAPKPSHEGSSYVFPKEPFSSETPEPSPSGNN